MTQRNAPETILKPTRRQLLAGAAALGATALTPSFSRRAYADDRKVLKVMSWEQFQPGEKDGWNALFEKFNQSQNKYKVEWTGWPAGQYISNVVIQAKAGGIDADVLMAMPDLAAQVIRKFKLAEPLDSIVSELGITPSGGHEFLKQDGKLYGLSAIDVNFALVYNKALFDKAGVQPATSQDEWIETTKKLTHRPDQFGIALATMDDQLRHIDPTRMLPRVTFVRSSLREAGTELIAELGRQCDAKESPRGTMIPSYFQVVPGFDPRSIDEPLPMGRRSIIG